MSARLTALLAALALSGCFDFDQAYATYCDGGRCASGGGGGSTGGGGGSTTGGGGGATTGGGGGSTTGGGGGTTGGGGGATGGGGGATGGGGGVTGGGGGTTGGGGGATGGGGGSATDGGCPQFLCPVVDWNSGGRSSSWFEVAPGLLGESINRFSVHAAFRGSTSMWSHFEYRFFGDGGVQEINRTTALDSRVEARQLRGRSATDFWFVYRTSATHLEGTSAPVDFASCGLPDGGSNDAWLYAMVPVSADEAYFAASLPATICQWTRSGGMIETAVAQGTYVRLYLNDIYRTPAGDLYAVGGDYDSNSSSSTGVIITTDGSRVTAPALVDTYYDDGFSSVGGTGDRVWALSRTGHILERRADGGFETVHQAPFRLAKLHVTPRGEVFAAGQEPTQLVYFDGGTWAEHLLPLTEFRADVRWENVWADDEAVVLSGFETQTDGGNRAVVNAYRRAGR